MHRRIAKEIARVEARYPNAMNEDEVLILSVILNISYLREVQWPVLEIRIR